jgi:hypothetical protein
MASVGWRFHPRHHHAQMGMPRQLSFEIIAK